MTACSRCARLGAKGPHACQGLQECRSFASVLGGGDAHPESTEGCSLLAGVCHTDRLESPPAQSPERVRGRERVLAALLILSVIEEIKFNTKHLPSSQLDGS